MKQMLNSIKRTAFEGLLGWMVCQAEVFAQGTAFTYHGQLNSGGNPANGNYDFRLLLYDSPSGGSVLGGPVTNLDVTASNGLFTMFIDFGPGVFTGGNNWLHLGVRTNGAANFTPLSPRQQLTPTPYAIFAESASAAGLTGTIPTASLSGAYGSPISLNNPGNSFSGNGAGLVGVNASLFGGLAASNFWQTAGNAGTVGGVNFLGTTDNQPLQLRANNEPGFELQYVAKSSGFPARFQSYGMNVVAGYWGNVVSNNALGATIAGGGDLAGALFPLTSYPNVVTGDFGTVGGGYANTAGGGGTIPGGYENIATGSGSFAAGRYAQTANNGSFIWGDGSKTFTSSGVNCFDVLASGGVFFDTGTAGVNVDQLGLNNGKIDYGLRFGIASGEGIASKRTAGGEQYGLDFYTSFSSRMTIANNGFVGIGTTSPSQQLEVNGEFLVVDGLGGVRCYLGDDGSGNDVQVGSLTSGVTAVACYNAADNAYMHLYCSSITIKGGADLAEPFPISQARDEVREGTVVVIDDEHAGRLKMSSRAYDSKVAGVVSGANGVKPGIQMQQDGLLEGGKNIALTGRVYVQADTSNGVIRPGDLLTTSYLPGHAMKVTDHARALGAILGKAMTELDSGQGTVLVLVTLQ